MKRILTAFIALATLVWIINSCETSPEICSDFCLDTLSGNAQDIKNYPVIDVHQHIYSQASFWNGGLANFGMVSARNYKSHYEALVKIMRENNVVIGLAGGPIAAIDYFYDNYYENHDLFWYGAEFSIIPKGSYEKTISLVSLKADEGRIKVIGELTGVYQNLSVNDTSYRSLYSIADTFSLPVFIHTGIVPESIYKYYPDYSFEYANPVTLKPLLEDWPNVNFNAAHFGISNHKDYDFEADMISMMSVYDNLYVDIGAAAWYNSEGISKTTSFIKRAINAGVENKILYASDEMVWPDAVRVSIDYIKNADFLTVQQKKKILYWNAAAYLKLSDEEVESHFRP